jgi:hypothetical protein
MKGLYGKRQKSIIIDSSNIKQYKASVCCSFKSRNLYESPESPLFHLKDNRFALVTLVLCSCQAQGGQPGLSGLRVSVSVPGRPHDVKVHIKSVHSYHELS